MSVSSSLKQVGIQGALLAGLPTPFLLAYLNVLNGIPPLWRLEAAVLAAFSGLVCVLILLRHPLVAKIFCACAALFSFLAASPYLLMDPFVALLGLVCLIGAGFALLDFNPYPGIGKDIRLNGYLLRAQWATVTVFGLIVFSLIISTSAPSFIVQPVIVFSGLIAQCLFIQWVWCQKNGGLRVIFIILAISFIGLLISSLVIGHTDFLALTFAFATFVLLFRSNPMQSVQEHGWETVFNHPARILISTFFGLILVGTLLLILPNSTREGGIALVDAAFTAVSAVCVTGLIVLDTPVVFTFLGQAFILLLIQLGGLGIMSLAAVAFHAMGRRLSLRHERLLSSMTESNHRDLVNSLIHILKFTFAAEGIGALILWGLFYASGDVFLQAAWRGLFTAVSAFCNAGFALQSNSMVPYQKSPLILQTVSTLIILGGLAPATSMLVPKWFMGRRIPIGPRIALITTAVMLVSGTVFFLAFEWNGVLFGLSLLDKIHNAWFQSATLRTAGFNSVNVAGVVNPTFMVMILFMFIGGSPGGTAGGVKTTTIATLVMTFWANINNRNSIIFQNRRLPSAIIYRAITIVTCFGVVWFAAILMLEVTQNISGERLIFEVASALGTVGLSMGATARLDEMGKVIIMMTMFAGRIGPMTLFMLLSEDVSVPDSDCADAKINLT